MTKTAIQLKLVSSEASFAAINCAIAGVVVAGHIQDLVEQYGTSLDGGKAQEKGSLPRWRVRAGRLRAEVHQQGGHDRREGLVILLQPIGQQPSGPLQPKVHVSRGELAQGQVARAHDAGA